MGKDQEWLPFCYEEQKNFNPARKNQLPEVIRTSYHAAKIRSSDKIKWVSGELDTILRINVCALKRLLRLSPVLIFLGTHLTDNDFKILLRMPDVELSCLLKANALWAKN